MQVTRLQNSEDILRLSSPLPSVTHIQPMSTPNPADRDAELARREHELRQRELELRIRELETQIQKTFDPKLPAETQTPIEVTPTRPHKPKKTRWNKWKGNIWDACQFFLIVLGVILAIRIASWLGMILIIGMISWVGYKVFFEVDD